MAKEIKARIVSWNPERGFGFAQLDDGCKVFVHVSTFYNAPPRGQNLVGSEIKFDEGALIETSKGLKIQRATIRLPEWQPRWDIGWRKKQYAISRKLEKLFAKGEMIAYQTVSKVSGLFPVRAWMVLASKAFAIELANEDVFSVKEMTAKDFLFDIQRKAEYLLNVETGVWYWQCDFQYQNEIIVAAFEAAGLPLEEIREWQNG